MTRTGARRLGSDGTGFATKPQMARQMVERVVAGGVYGQNRTL